MLEEGGRGGGLGKGQLPIFLGVKGFVKFAKGEGFLWR